MTNEIHWDEWGGPAIKGRRGITITIDGTPVSKLRPRVTKKGITFTPAKTRKWENYARLAAQTQMQGFPPLEGALYLRVAATFPIPETWPRWKREQALAGKMGHTAKPDGDNVLKAVKDALNGIAWIDDAQVVTHTMGKLYGTKPGIQIEVKQMPDLIPSQQKTKPAAA